MQAQRGYLAALLGQVSNLDTDAKNGVQSIPLAQIAENDRNFYDMSDLDGLVDAILLDGLQSPLVVQQRGVGDYVLISGHRRRAALEKIHAAGWAIAPGKLFAAEIAAGLAPCLINAYSSQLQAELALIRANSETRVLSAAEVAQQAQRVEELLYQMKAEGFDFPGKMRDHVAAICRVSASKLARLKVIREKLAPPLLAQFEQGLLRESMAYALAKLPQDQQQLKHAKEEPPQARCDSTEPAHKAPTNADRIRAMSDEELAAKSSFLFHGKCKVTNAGGNAENCPMEEWHGGLSPCDQCALAWLRQPSEED